MNEVPFEVPSTRFTPLPVDEVLLVQNLCEPMILLVASEESIPTYRS
jgi:hypothetical protein